ncbi:cytochrome P450 [Auriculariales sp. MPI-PUGE-AT-0066]|nr:cytochrome P450 [Auriculariales sp. MPI-PUGE-AT-0066]
MSYMCGWRNAFALLMYGDRLRTTKRITNNVLNQRACQRYIPIQQDTALRLVKKLFRGSDQVDKSLHWFSARILLKIVYDHEVAEDGEDELVLLNEEGNMQFSAAASPGWLVDIFPSLRYLPEWFPGAGFIRQARFWNKTAFAMYDVPFQMVKAAMATGTSHHQSHSLAASLLRGENGSVMSDEEEDIIRYATGSMYGAGGETTASALQTFFLVMVLNPEIQRLAQAEIDLVTGGDRFPTYDDRASLPYINALVKEVLRWQPAVPTGIPHCSTAEDHYRDWLIPAQTTIIVNIWQLLRDPKLYPDPHTFKPERFLDTALNKSNSALNPDPSTFVFGFGRRECPGRHLADASVFLAIATCLASFHISARRDSNGGPVLPKSTFSGGVISRPDELACVLKPRSAHAAKWLQAD